MTGIIPKHLIPESKVPNKNQPESQQQAHKDNIRVNNFRNVDLEKLNFALEVANRGISKFRVIQRTFHQSK